MPYKDPEIRKANRRLKRYVYRDQERMLAIQRFQAMGLEVVDINDQTSALFCEECGKQTPRSASYVWRHEENCSHFSTRMPLLRYPVSKYAKA